MNFNDETAAAPDDASGGQPGWCPLTRVQRRIVGVLVEKAKTTPEQYPLTLNALTNGCNQKSNRSPQMSLEADDVEAEMDDLREMGVIVEIQGGSRVAKYKHRMYEWLGVDKVELAVMAELLLRGEQTIGELRGRAARMEPIPDLAALKPVLQSLIEKGLVLELTPAGRGQLVSHALYEETELAQVRERASSMATSEAPRARSSSREPAPREPAPRDTGPRSGASADEVAALRSEIEELRAEVSSLRHKVEDLERLLA